MASLKSFTNNLYSSQLQLYELVIARHYNSLVANVAKCLILNSPSTLHTISRYTKIELNDIKKALILLILHDIVRPSTHINPDSTTQIYYSVLLDNILSRLLLPVILTAVGQMYSKLHSQLLFQFAKYGSLCLDKCVSLTHTAIKSPNSIASEFADSFYNEAHAQISLSNALNDLIICQLIAISNNPISVNCISENNINPNFLPPAYKLNLESLTQLLYNQEIIENASMRIGHISVAKTVLLALITSGIPMTPSQVHDYITNCSQENTTTLEYTTRILSGLARHPDGIVNLSTIDEYSPEPKYTINLKRSRELMLHRILFGCIEQSCGIMGARIWNLLVTKDNKFWNPQFVSQQALMPLSTVRSLLYSLSLKGYIRIHELSGAKMQSINTPVFNAGIKQMQSLHFTCNIKMSTSKVLQDCYKIATNLIHKLNLISNGQNRLPSSQDLKKNPENMTNCDLLESSLLHMAKLLFLLTNSI